MGVPLLLTWLRRRFSSCFHPADGDVPNSVNGCADNLYIDLNGLLYHSANLVSLSGAHFDGIDDVEAAIQRKLYDLLDDIVFRLVNPKALVYIAVDGVSPLGKMSQQRSRRRRQTHRRRPAGNMETLWDTNCISVGTRFMAKVTDALHVYAVSRAERINAKRYQEAIQASSSSGGTTAAAASSFVPISVIVDDVIRPGEGENKIAEAIRRYRAQPEYNPNTSHVICSSDTDVTVSSLVLHEQRIHVLRYEPPASLGGHQQNNGGGDKRRSNTDAWLSSFFSIHIFRESLRESLGLSPVSSDPEEAARQVVSFENALHDVVFVMLLFGNDFLPGLGGSIQEGTLDALLALLASDFVSRNRTVVDPTTNHILFSSARYLLDCLADILGESNKPHGVLNVNGMGADMAWGFDDDAEFQALQRRKEQVEEKKCYCYWTMLQWALQYSAGVIDHWGCYYPYTNAPPLHMLRKYCGVLSYDGLVQFAASRHAARKAGVADVDSVQLSGISTEDTAVAVQRGVTKGSPTNVMVQLMILIPPHSVALLPTALRSKYAEIADTVQAPVEELDMDAIQVWCEDQSRALSEEERTRFSAYQLFSSEALVSGDAKEGEKPLAVPAREITFMAHWPVAAYREDLAAAQSAAPPPQPSQQEGGKPPAAPTRTAASFFGARRTGAAAASSAAAAALLQAPSVPSVTATAADSTEEVVGAQQLEVLTGASRSYTMVVGPCGLLRDAPLIQAMGVIHGSRFQVGSAIDDGTVLSRSTELMRVRMAWSLAAAPALPDDMPYLSSLLPGCTTPVEQTYQEKIAEQRQTQLEKADPWKRLGGKRERSEDSENNTADA